jgi:hypothetical protein
MQENPSGINPDLPRIASTDSTGLLLFALSILVVSDCLMSACGLGTSFEIRIPRRSPWFRLRRVWHYILRPIAVTFLGSGAAKNNNRVSSGFEAGDCHYAQT